MQVRERRPEFLLKGGEKVFFRFTVEFKMLVGQEQGLRHHRPGKQLNKIPDGPGTGPFLPFHEMMVVISEIRPGSQGIAGIMNPEPKG